MEHTFVLHQNRLVSIGSDAVADACSSTTSSPITANMLTPPASEPPRKVRKRPHANSTRRSQSQQISPSIKNNPSYYHRPRSVASGTKAKSSTSPSAARSNSRIPLNITALPPSIIDSSSPKETTMQTTSPASLPCTSVLTPTTPYSCLSLNTSITDTVPGYCHSPWSPYDYYSPWTPLDYQSMYMPQPGSDEWSNKRQRCESNSHPQDGNGKPPVPNWAPSGSNAFYDPNFAFSPTPQDPSWMASPQFLQQWWAR